LEVPRQHIDKILSKSDEESSEQIREKVIKAWEIQNKRFKNEFINFNSQMDSKLIQKYCPLSDSVKDILKQANQNMNLSARSIHRIIKLARTLADLD
jgi:magnesium chelatase family protein